MLLGSEANRATETAVSLSVLSPALDNASVPAQPLARSRIGIGRIGLFGVLRSGWS